MIRKSIFLFFALFILLHLTSCAGQFGTTVITKPDEHTHVYEAKEKVILKSIAGILKDKNIGSNVVIDERNHRIDSDYVVSGEWRTKTIAHVKKLNWKECEVTLAVTTEKKTKTGWEMRRLLKKEQYDNFFSEIELRIYEEMSKIN